MPTPTPNQPLFCKDCQYFVSREAKRPICFAPATLQTDLVFGQATKACAEARDKYGPCGPDAKLFLARQIEAADIPDPALLGQADVTCQCPHCNQPIPVSVNVTRSTSEVTCSVPGRSPVTEDPSVSNQCPQGTATNTNAEPELVLLNTGTHGNHAVYGQAWVKRSDIEC